MGRYPCEEKLERCRGLRGKLPATLFILQGYSAVGRMDPKRPYRDRKDDKSEKHHPKKDKCPTAVGFLELFTDSATAAGYFPGRIRILKNTRTPKRILCDYLAFGLSR